MTPHHLESHPSEGGQQVVTRDLLPIGHQPVWIQLRCSAGQGGVGVDRGAGDAAGGEHCVPQQRAV